MTPPISFTYDKIEPSLYWKAAQAACNPRGTGYVMNLLQSIVYWIVLFLLLIAMMDFALKFDVVEQGAGAFVVGIFITYVGILLYSRILRIRLSKVLRQEQDLRGSTSVEVGPDGCRFSSSFGDTFLKWRGIDAIVDLRGGTGLRSGLFVYIIPTGKLPENISPEDFRQALEEWREAP